MTPGLVPNPRYQDLEGILRRLRRDADLLERALDKPAKRMASRQVWVSDKGGTAATFERDLAYQRQQLRFNVRKLIATVEDALSRTPKEVTPLQAAMGS